MPSAGAQQSPPPGAKQASPTGPKQAPAAKQMPPAKQSKSTPRGTPSPAASGAPKAASPGGAKAAPRGKRTPPAAMKGAAAPARQGAPSGQAVPGAKRAGGQAEKAGGSAAKGGGTGGGAGPATTGRPRGGPTREERMAAAEAVRRRRSIRNRTLVAAGVVAAIVVVGFVIVSDRRERDQEAAQVQTDSCRFDRKSDNDGGLNNNHVPNPTYQVNPPAGGDHTPQAAGAGIFTDANTPSDGQIVHAMEHGYIVIWHRPDLDEPTLASLRELVGRHARDVLMVPRASIETPVAATAWHARLLCDQPEVDTIERFINTFVNRGPERVPH